MSSYKRAHLVAHRRGLVPASSLESPSQTHPLSETTDSGLSTGSDATDTLMMRCKRKFDLNNPLDFDGAPQKLFASESHVIECLRELHLFDSKSHACLGQGVGLPSDFTNATIAENTTDDGATFPTVEFELEPDSSTYDDLCQPRSEQNPSVNESSDSECEDDGTGQRLHIEDPELKQALNGLYKNRLNVLARLKGAHVNVQRDLEDGIPLVTAANLPNLNLRSNVCRSVVLWTPLTLPFNFGELEATEAPSASGQCVRPTADLSPTTASAEMQLDTVRNELVAEELVELEPSVADVEFEAEMQVEPI